MGYKPVMIVESNSNGLLINESASVPKDDKFILSGPFTEFDVKNRNDRIYTSEKFMPHLNELNGRIKSLGAVYGEFDHPEAFDISLSRISHVLENLNYNEKMNRVDGSIRLLNTHYGKEAKALVMDGCPLFVSSRAAGVTESDGTVTIKKLFTYDAVADPGFASARMEVVSMNESLGFNESANFRVYDMSDESKINTLFEMNKNDQVTQQQMTEYTDYLNSEISKVKNEMNENIKSGNNPEKLGELSEYYDSLMENYTKMSKYLDYLADHIQVLVTENKDLKDRTEKIIEHNDYLSENLEKSINYSNYLAEKIEKNIDYSEYIAENLEKTIDFSEYVAENVDKSIKYSEYIAENLDKAIDYSEYIAEHTEFSLQNNEMLSEYIDNSIKYSEYVAEKVDTGIQYSEYLAEKIDNNIQYAEYIAEHVDNNIAYAEYIAENVSDTQAYSKYIAESLDKTIDNINGNKLNEDVEGEDQRISDLKIANVDKYYDDEDDEDSNEFPPEDSDLPTELLDIDEEEEEEEEEETIEDDNIDALGDDMIEPTDNDDLDNEIVQPENVELTHGSVVTVGTEDGEKTGTILSIDKEVGIITVQIPTDVQDVQEVQDEVQGVQEIQDEVQDDETSAQIDIVQPEDVQSQAQFQEIQVQESNILSINGVKVSVKGNLITESVEEVINESVEEVINESVEVEEEEEIEEEIFEANVSITDSIAELITEAKKRKASETERPHFLYFMSDKNQSVWNDLSNSDKETIIVAMNESSYTNEAEVLNIIGEALQGNKKTDEEILIESIPSDLVDSWNGLNDTVKKSVLTQAKFYPNLISSEAKMESFWNTRGLEKYMLNETKTLINENKQYVDDVKLSDNQVDKYLNIFRNL